ncbi:MAG: PKD domain-containing protein [Sphingobacteriales bacterium]|nr:PKD domain-containing protein [Sphingobacteriales bacterium]
MGKRIITSALLLAVFFTVQAQDFSNRGKDFWVAYGNHVRFTSGNPLNGQEMVLYLTSTQTTSYTISIPGTGWSTSGTIPANTVVTSLPIPKAGGNDARLTTEGKFNRGIHVTADKPVVAYAHIYNQNVSGAGILFPTNTLGREYYSINFTQQSNEGNSYSWFYAIATEDSTRIEITPSAATLNGRPAGVPFDTLLMKGEVYNVMSFTDLTGSRIRSISTGTNGCKRIAVFSGSGKIFIECGDGSQQSADNLIQQCFPATAWGKKYITVPTQNMKNNYFRVAVTDPSTVVKRNGVVLTGLINGFYYEFKSNTPNIIESDKPVMVSQYITTRTQCGNFAFGSNSGQGGDGDPEMIYLSPVEQTVDNITLNSTPNFEINEHYVNVVIKTNAINSFTLDGGSFAGSFTPVAADPTYSYAQIPVGQGQHNLKADSGFNAIAYGYGFAESYGYNAGANVIDLYQYISTQNQYATVKSPTACKSSPFIISITLPYQPLSMTWDIPNYPKVTINAPLFDSTFKLGDKQLYYYKLPATYVYDNIGTYPIKVTINNPTAEGCPGIQEVDFDLEVFSPPTASYTYTTTGCVTDSLAFTDNSNGNGRPVAKYFWDFGDGKFDYTKNPKHKYALPGTYTVQYSILTDIGCLSDTLKKVISVSNPPIADFSISNPNCEGKPITFTDKTVTNGSTIVKWNWDFGNAITNAALNGNPVTNSYATVGTYKAKLFVETSTGCKSLTDSLNVIVYNNPVVDFSIPSTVCLPSGLSQFNDLSTIADGTQAQFTYIWDFGDPASGAANGSIVKNPSHNYSGVGPYNIKLRVTSKDGCFTENTKALTNIYPQSKANFSFPAELCLGATASFTDMSDGKGRTVTQRFWDFGDGTTSILINPTHTYAIADTFDVKLYIKTDVGCNSDTIVKKIIINPLPKPDFTITNPSCEKNAVTVNDISQAFAGSIIKWNWDLNDGTVLNNTNNTPFTHTYSNWGNYTVKLDIETNKGCKSLPFSKTIKINPLPKPGFILPEVCLDDAFALFLDSSKIADNSQALVTYKWVLDDPAATPANPNVYTVKNPQHKYAAIGNYTANLIVTSKDGCVDSLKQSFTVNGDIPKADYNIATLTSLCSNDSIAIANISSVNFGNVTKVEIYWDWANNPALKDVDDLPATNKLYKHIYTNFQSPVTKTFQVRMLAYSGATCADEQIKPVTVNASPKIQFNIIPGICLDAQAYQITQAKELSGLSGSFTYSGKGISAAGLFDPVAAGVGVHTIKSLYTSTAGCRDSATNTIEVWPRPTGDFNILNPNCETQAITFADKSVANAGNLAKWNWSFGDGGTKTGNPATHVFAAAGNSTVTLQVITDRACTSVPVTKNIKINPLPKVDFDLPKVCLPAGTAPFADKSTIADGTQAQFSYLWNFGDVNAGGNNANTSTSKNPTHNYSALGPYTVSLKVTSKDGCSSAASKQLTEVFPQPQAMFNAVNEVCVGKDIQFTDLSSGIVSPVNKWQWNFGDGTSSSLQSPVHLYKDPGFYTATLTIYTTEGCVSNLNTKQISIRPYPAISAGPDLFVLEDGEKTIQSSVNASTPYGNIETYLWTPSTYLSATNILNPVIINPKNDITYKLTATGTGGCVSTDEVFVKVLKGLVIPNTFTPNGDGANDTWIIQYLDSYPGSVVEIYNAVGQLLFRSIGYNKPWDGTYNGSPLPVGTYYYVIDPKNNRKPVSGYVTILR